MKRIAKRTVTIVCAVLVLPAVIVYRLQAMIAGPDRVFSGWAQFFSLLPGLTGIHLRHAFLRATTDRCGDDACVSFGTIFSHPNVSIGQTAYIGHYCSIGNVTIEDDVLIASHVSIMNGCHQHGTSRLDIPLREQPGHYEPVTIGRDSWIGERATIAASVGQHCIIGAGSLVLSPVPDYSIAVGVPARIIRDRRQSDKNVEHSTMPAAALPKTSAQTAAVEHALDCVDSAISGLM
jgi:acetyltransferase-like isoleucine patch superfamily enzyme